MIGGIVASYHLSLRLVDRRISQAHTRRQAFGQPVHLPVGTVEQVVVVPARPAITFIGKACIQRRLRCRRVVEVGIGAVGVHEWSRIGVHLREAIDLPRGIDAAWLIDVHESRRDVKSHREIVRHLEVEIRTIIETAIQIVVVDAVATREVAHKTVLDEIASRNEILQTLRATAHVDVHIRLRGHLLKDLMIPVHVGMAVGVVTRAEML